MNAPYDDELRALQETYASMLAADPEPLRVALEELGRGPAVFVGSGGTMVLANVAARLHEWTARQPARACTSLELVDLPQMTQRGALLFTSSAKHPDAHRVLADLRRARFRPAAVLTHRSPDHVAEVAGPDVRVVQMSPLAQQDGFLATGSILQMVVGLLRGYLENPMFDESLPERFAPDAELRSEVVVLTPPALTPVACDIEVRLVESGLAAVQVTDYRNFAHGRHTGFARRMDDTTVIALSDSDSEALATGTVEVLPRGADVRRWHHDGEWPRALVSLLVRSMRLAGSEAPRAGLDIARPTVPTFGRRLYRLPLGKRVPVHLTGAVERKLLALGAGDASEMRALYGAAAEKWSAEVGEQRFGALVLDYDGTVCWTSRRRALPGEAVCEVLERLLEGGLIIGFASGRGQSLHRDLRRWLPEAFWRRVLLGLYNGAVRLRLDERLDDLRDPTPWSRSVVESLAALPLRARLDVQERGAQVTVELARGTLHHGHLGELVRERLASAGVPGQVVASGHSLDIVAAEARKTLVVDATAELSDAPVLAIGDQGQAGGNDHALLAHSPWTLSVDRCSADPTRCWFAGNGRAVGPDLLVRYLSALKSCKRGFALSGLEVA